MPKKQACDGCGFLIRHGWPFLHKLFCSQACQKANLHKTNRNWHPGW